MDVKKTVKTSQEQAITEWVNYLFQDRINNLQTQLGQQKDNFSEAMKDLNVALKIIDKDIIERNRGGDKGMHGFIAEVAECGIGNAREKIKSGKGIYVWVDDNGPIDLLKNGVEVQQKFVNAGGKFSLKAVLDHKEKYPDFLNNGQKYQIPKDHYDKVKRLWNMSESEAGKLTKNGDFSFRDWEKVQEFANEGKIDLKDLEPSILEYKEVQAGVVDKTFKKEKTEIQKENRARQKDIHDKNKPGIKDATKAIAVAAVLEGGTTFAMELIGKIKERGSIKDLNIEDWEEIAKKTGVNTGKGAVRGTIIFTMTNFLKTPAAVANSIATTSFGVAEQVYLFKKEQISEKELYENLEILCVESAISVIGPMIGQAVIPVPLIGAIIGNAVSSMIYQIAKENFDKSVQEKLFEYAKSLKKLDTDLDSKYEETIKLLDENFEIYILLVEKSFSPDVEVALEGSVDLAKEVGVPIEELLDSKEKIDDYFMN